MVEYFSLRDLKHSAFSKPFPSPHVHDAQRGLAMTLKQGKSMEAAYPADYELWRVAEFNEELGAFVNAPSMICNLSSLVEASDGQA